MFSLLISRVNQIMVWFSNCNIHTCTLYQREFNAVVEIVCFVFMMMMMMMKSDELHLENIKQIYNTYSIQLSTRF